MSTPNSQLPTPNRTLLHRLGLHRPELRAWAWYDWANSAFMTTVVAAVFPIYYAKVAADGVPDATATFRFGIATTIALTATAVLSPILGALADATGRKKRLLAVFAGIGIVATAGLGLVGRGDWMLALGLFMLGNIGIYGSMTFYDALLPHIARPEELDRVSSAGYALGYLGGGVLLAINLAWIQRPAWFGFPDAGTATRAAFVSVAVWWAVFSVPILRRVPEPPVDPATAADASIGAAIRRLANTLRELRRYRHAFTMLVAFMLYNDGIGTIIRMATLYGTQVGIDQGSLIGALLLVQFIGVPAAFLFGAVAAKIGAKPAILGSLVLYTVISVLAFRMTTARDFMVLAALVGLVQGGSQALSRSVFASLIPKDRTAEFFGFFAVFEKFAGVFGPLLFSAAVALTHSNRAAILSVILFFVAGGALLVTVDIDAGRRAAER
ncbi:MAG: MFS transporter [Vicinamibacteraceae bacterium]